MATIQRRNRQRGKAAERKVAALTGGARVGVMGGEDVFHPDFSIEVKSMTRFVGRKWMTQCEKNNKRGKTPIVIVHTKGTQHETSDLVLMKFSDFQRLCIKK